MLPKSFAVIRSHLVLRVGVLVLGVMVASMLKAQWAWFFSAVLGALFSYLSWWLLFINQYAILQKRDKRLFFMAFLGRLGLYAIPLCIGLFYTTYFNLWIILVFLFAFQFNYILLELVNNWGRYQRKIKK